MALKGLSNTSKFCHSSDCAIAFLNLPLFLFVGHTIARTWLPYQEAQDASTTPNGKYLVKDTDIKDDSIQAKDRQTYSRL